MSSPTVPGEPRPRASLFRRLLPTFLVAAGVITWSVILEQNEALFRSEVLMIECSFLQDGHQDRAAKYRHIHIDDIADFAGRFENEHIVLTHFSRRYSRDEIQDLVRRRLPVSLHDRIRLALPDPWQRLA